MEKLKVIIIQILSLGVYPGLEGSKKLAIQVATFDGLWTMVTMFFYVIYFFFLGYLGLGLIFCFGLGLMTIGLWLLSKHRYDSGRAILHLTALTQIFLSGDATGAASGYELYYFTSITIPFFTFALEERLKGYFLSGIAFVTLVVQQFIGTGLFMPKYMPTSTDKMVSIIMVVVFMVAVLSVARWQMDLARRELEFQQGEVIHASNLRALGEMAGGIAHEISNPLQTLSLQSEQLRSAFEAMERIPPAVSEQLDTVDHTIRRIKKLIKGLRDLTRDVSNDPMGYFTMKEMLDDVLGISSERLKNLGIKLIIHGDRNLAANGNMVQISQVLINLLNNSIDALEDMKDKWITIGFMEKKDRIQIVVTDSGAGIPKDIAKKLMTPFFTTKGAGRGTGLGLSISKNIVEKNGGKFFFDANSTHTRFVIELPGISESI